MGEITPIAMNRGSSELRLTVLYGSQTGTAQEVAERIYWAARRRGFQPDISAMDYFPRDQLPGCRLVVFVVSTTGAGEPLDNMRSLWSFLLRKSLPASALQNTE